MLCDDLNGEELKREGIYVYVLADLLYCTVEINTTLQSNYTPIKINQKSKIIIDNDVDDLSGVTERVRWQDPNPFTLLVSQLPLPSPHPATYHLYLGPLPQHTPSEQSPHGWVAILLPPRKDTPILGSE